MKISARNLIKGKVKSLDAGPVNAKIEVDIGNGQVITSIITAGSVQDLNLEVGMDVHAVIKASDVMLAVD